MLLLYLLSLVIKQCIFTGFSIYTISYIVGVSFFKDSRFLKKFDKAAINVALVSGIVYSVLVLLFTITSNGDYFTGTNKYNQDVHVLYENIYAIVCVFATQLLWIKNVRKEKFLRLLVAVPLLFSYKAFIGFIIPFTTYSSSLLADNFNTDYNFEGALFDVANNTFWFLMIIVVYYFISKKITDYRRY